MQPTWLGAQIYMCLYAKTQAHTCEEHRSMGLEHVLTHMYQEHRAIM